jgi:hypothetical protein
VTRRKVENNKWGREQQFASGFHCCDRNARVFNLHQDQVNWDNTGMENPFDHQFNDSLTLTNCKSQLSLWHLHTKRGLSQQNRPIGT